MWSPCRKCQPVSRMVKEFIAALRETATFFGTAGLDGE